MHSATAVFVREMTAYVHRPNTLLFVVLSSTVVQWLRDESKKRNVSNVRINYTLLHTLWFGLCVYDVRDGDEHFKNG